MDKKLSEAIDLVDGIFHSTSFKNQKGINDGWDVIKYHLGTVQDLALVNQALGDTLLSLTEEMGIDGAATLPTTEQVKATMDEYKKAMVLHNQLTQDAQKSENEVNDLRSVIRELKLESSRQLAFIANLEGEYQRERRRANSLEDELEKQNTHIYNSDS